VETLPQTNAEVWIRGWAEAVETFWYQVINMIDVA
jgi:hypothetical protein